METEINYTARIIDMGVTSFIDIQPPIVASEEALEDFGVSFGVKVGHSVTTPSTTRLTAHVENESLSNDEKFEVLRNTAEFIIGTLSDIDNGQVWGQQPDRVETTQQPYGRKS